jgi:hypothetical protein
LECNDAVIATETFSGSLSMREEAEYTFNTTLNFAAGSDYEIKVTVIFSGDKNPNNDSKTINVTNTLCDVINSFPYQVGFEDNGFEFPACWLQDYVENNRSWEVVTKSDKGILPHSGTYMVEFLNYYYSEVTVTKLITPPMDITGLSTPTLKFWHFQNKGNTSRPPLKVYYKTSTTAEWKLLAEYAAWAGWTQRTLDLPEPSSSYFIAFEATDGNTTEGVLLDDISILQGTPRNDAELLAIKTDGNTGKITAVIKNSGNVPITSLSASYKLDNGTPVVEQVTENIAPLVGIYEHTFATTVPQGYYNLTVTLNLTGDQNSGNNSLTRDFVNKPTLTLTGCRVGIKNPPVAMISFTTSNPENTTVASSFMDGTYNEKYEVTAATFVKNKLHLFTNLQADNKVFLRNYATFSLPDWGLVSYKPVPDESAFHADMTYDYSTNTMYSFYDSNIQKVNLETGAVTIAGTITGDIYPWVIACDLAGTLYMVGLKYENSWKGVLYKVNKNDFSLTEIGYTGVQDMCYRQSMTFDHGSGRLLWAAYFYRTYTDNTFGELMEIDIKTGKAWNCGTIGAGSGTEICGLFTYYSGSTAITEPNSILQNVKIYSHQNTVYIVNEEEIPLKSVQVFDIMGRMIYQNSVTGSTNFTLSAATGIYMVRLISEEGKVFAEKVYLGR